MADTRATTESVINAFASYASSSRVAAWRQIGFNIIPAAARAQQRGQVGHRQERAQGGKKCSAQL